MGHLAKGEPMADEKKEPWLNFLALTTVILAVCATFSTFKGGGYSVQAQFNNDEAMGATGGAVTNLAASPVQR